MSNIDWSMLITKAMKDAQAALALRAKKVIIEDAWRNSEINLIANQLMAIEEYEAGGEVPDLLPGTRTQWLAYRTKVRAWKEGHIDFPNELKRPVRPT
jgi:hypothetical protein